LILRKLLLWIPFGLRRSCVVADSVLGVYGAWLEVRDDANEWAWVVNNKEGGGERSWAVVRPREQARREEGGLDWTAWLDWRVSALLL
jgi:hypothetical protein